MSVINIFIAMFQYPRPPCKKKKSQELFKDKKITVIAMLYFLHLVSIKNNSVFCDCHFKIDHNIHYEYFFFLN